MTIRKWHFFRRCLSILIVGAILWAASTSYSIFIVMRYAKKVKADKGSTILSLQEQEDSHNASQ
jgi:uncharacterized ion transporter superfamily protein YfcC